MATKNPGIIRSSGIIYKPYTLVLLQLSPEQEAVFIQWSQEQMQMQIPDE